MNIDIDETADFVLEQSQILRGTLIALGRGQFTNELEQWKSSAITTLMNFLTEEHEHPLIRKRAVMNMFNTVNANIQRLKLTKAKTNDAIEADRWVHSLLEPDNFINHCRQFENQYVSALSKTKWSTSPLKSFKP